MKNTINKILSFSHLLPLVFLLIVVVGCDDNELPEANSRPDMTPPDANFSYAAGDVNDFRVIKFTNLSTESLSYLWEFGDGDTSTEEEPSFTFEDEGDYEVTLIATDGLNVSSSITRTVSVTEGPFQPVVLEAGFEDNTLPDGTGDGRDSWRNNDLGGVIQITSSPVLNGSQGAKLTGSPNDQRIGYQEIVVDTATTYDVNFFYTMFSTPVGFITVDILDASGGTITSQEEAESLVLGSITVNNQEDPSTYVASTVTFNSGESNLIAIYFYNEGSVESRLDDFSIEIGSSGAIPPSANFSAEQSNDNFLEYSFINSSVNADSYLWDFGDGNTSTEESPTYVYETADVYTVTLTALSDGGLSGEFSTSIDIQDPVYAGFEFEVDANNFRTIMFNDTSINAESVLWDFGDGFLSALDSPSHTYTADGIYLVSLTATSSTGLTSVATAEVTISTTFVPVIMASGFENLADGTDARDFWRNSDLGGVIQISTSSDFVGEKSSKYPNSNDRIAYQEIDVLAGTNYDLSYMYSIEGQGDGISVTVKVLGVTDNGGTLTDPAQIDAVTLAQHVGTNGTGKAEFTDIVIPFNSGVNTKVAIYVENAGAEVAYVDEFSMFEGDGVPPIVTNGDFEDKQNDWKPSAFTGGNTNPFNSSSDGSWNDYNGTNTGSKTGGAKWTQSTSAGPLKSADSRYGYQALNLDPNTTYVFEFEYAIKSDDATEPDGGRRVVGEILPGHFEDGADAAAVSEAGNALVTQVGAVAEGKFSDTVGEKLTAEFTTDATGAVSIWLWAVTPVDAYIDNVKVYAK